MTRPSSEEVELDPVPEEELPEQTEFLWQVRSGETAQGPWKSLQGSLIVDLERAFLRDSIHVEGTKDGVMYGYNLRAWTETMADETRGRPLRRVPNTHRLDSSWSPLGPEHADGGWITTAPMSLPPLWSEPADDQEPAWPLAPEEPDEEPVYWQFRGGKSGFGKWRWSEDSDWLEWQWQSRYAQRYVYKTYGDVEYEYDLLGMTQTNLSSETAPVRALRRWHHTWNLPAE